jgi:serine/threonine protein kinase
VELVDFVTEGDLSIFVLEFVPSTLLQHIVRCNEAGTYSEWNAAQYVLQVAEALNHCHNQGVVHLDVKLDNCKCVVNSIVNPYQRVL